jgi:hypothetical protein
MADIPLSCCICLGPIIVAASPGVEVKVRQIPLIQLADRQPRSRQNEGRGP